ncbi:Casein kinase I isoform alpha [Tritrichomonas foetus]|uniref:non-specific serine/threonine protein kinase n=1 Tax=Tritrichomonas foetus TaxID=1144522 RepID=A0A1J4JDB4_9EUKA|nr:Casein kinase I isoform alpha [Tritrichomonas foetus]|eukprot:OHS97190.1 Casein kinase I isoform alpha [Tritrichomonas foetus]
MTDTPPIIFPEGKMIEDYKVVDHIGHGGYGEIYSVLDTRNNVMYAMKVEMKAAAKQGLVQEIEFFETLKQSPLFPEYVYSGSNSEFRFLIMELLGPSLSKMRRALPNHRYTPICSIRLAYHMLRCIEKFHEQGFIHRDIKPGNFLIRCDRENPVCLTDFGLSKSYLIDPKRDRSHIPFREQVGFVGTCKYASIHAHEGRELSRRDDLLSWFYSIIELAESRVPWPGSRDRDRTFYMKKSTKPEHLCRALPIEFAMIYNNLMSLQFDQKPDYRALNNLLSEAMRKVDCEKKFDWEFLDDETLDSISAIPLKFQENDKMKMDFESNTGAMPSNNEKKKKDEDEQEGGCCTIQ